MVRRIIAALAAAAFLIMGTAGVAHAEEGRSTTLKLATLAPKNSPWGKVFRIWVAAVNKKTNGGIKLDFLYNGVAGPEDAVVGKIKSGQIAGAAVTVVGLTAVSKELAVFGLPGAFGSWRELDAARKKIGPDLVATAEKQGFVISGWGDVGIARVMSKGFAIKGPNDLKGKHLPLIRGDVVSGKVYEAIGGVAPVSATVVDILPKLNSGAINVLITPALAAEQLQWASRLDNLNTAAVSFSTGAVVMSKKELDKLSADQREIMSSTGKQAAEALTARIRKEDDSALARVKKKMTPHDPSDAEKAEWKKVFKKACTNLKPTIPNDAVGKIGAC